ncbi:HelD family protein [Rugosimonospora acidiphila]|uniref:HelD family protein n=1 Tax=Rugosimonospora acidiphila TaxID=556531 RepID=UPI0031F0C9EB
MNQETSVDQGPGGDRDAEIAEEQTYFDAAAGFRERKLAGLGDLALATAHRGAAKPMRQHIEQARQAIGQAGEAVAYGRIDGESGEVLYVGPHLIRDDDSEVLVVNWRATAAAPYFAASHADPRGVRRKRVFECTGNTIQSFTDVVFAEIAATVDDYLLGELDRARTGQMRDIVATIQAAQYDLIRAPLDQVLIVDGGPGTGKTAVALHRVSWLLFQHPDRLDADSVLVVGPHPTFIRYIGRVLPELGDTQVRMADVGRLAPDVHRGRNEPEELAGLKGEARMAGLLARALDARIGAPEPAERLLIGGRFVTLPGADVAEAVSACRAAIGPYTQRRQLLRDRLVALVLARTGVDSGGDPALANLAERLWPQQSAPAFLRDLFGSRQRLRTAAGDEFTEAETASLVRRGADRLSQEVWSAADLPLLDELDHLINGPKDRYGHVVVDEAQDLSPMQLRSVGRRSTTGSLTLVGDIAQSTGPWARDDWAEVTRHLPDRLPTAVAELRYGYRVPRQLYRYAARLLPVAAPGARPPEVVRDGPAEPGIHRVGLSERAGRTVALAMRHSAAGLFVGIVCPPRCRRETEAALAENGVEWSSADRGELGAAVNLVSPREAKGLEFDAVIVVEPEQIVAGDERGHRMLYVALTRATRHLDIVCVGEPLPLSVPASAPTTRDGVAAFGERDVRRLAEHLAGQVRGAAPEQAWPGILHRLAELLTPPAD